MGLFNAVIADARPAKSRGRTTYTAGPLIGQLLHKSKNDPGMADSGVAAAAHTKNFSNELKRISTPGPNTSPSYALPSVPNKKQMADKEVFAHNYAAEMRAWLERKNKIPF